MFSDDSKLRNTNKYESTNRMVRRGDLIYPDLCYKIVGILFDVYNELGSGHKEKYYQFAISAALRNNKISFKSEVYIPLEYRGLRIGKYFLDFLIENKVVLEVKQSDHYLTSNIRQIYSYLKATNLQLGILANFTKSGIKFKRVVNIGNSYIRKIRPPAIAFINIYYFNF